MISPPNPIKKFYYLCDSSFYTEYLEELFSEAENEYGVVMIFGEEAEFYLFDDKVRNRLLGKIRGRIANKQGRGGSSKNRIERLRQEDIHRYLVGVIEGIRKFYTKNGLTIVKKIILSGSGMKKNMVKEKLEFLTCPINVYSDLEIKDISERFGEIILEDRREDSKKNLDEILEYMRVNSDLLVFGEENIMREISEGGIRKIWIDKDIKIDRIEKIVMDGLEQYGGINE